MIPFLSALSWIPIRDPNLYWTIKSDGYCKVHANGANERLFTPDRGRSYLIAKVPPSDIASLLDDLLTLPPKLKN